MALIVISGKARVGKDTLGEYMKKHFKDNYFPMAYATELKRRCMRDYDLTWDQVYGDLKEVPDERYRRLTDKDELVFWTPREILQHMGTEAYRAVDNNFWIKQLFRYINRNNLKNVIVTDGRFPDEIKAITSRGGYHIRVERDHEIEVHGKAHASETSLDSFNKADFVVENNGTLDDLEEVAKSIIKEIEKNG